MHQALRLEFGIVSIDLTEQPLNAHVLGLLGPSLDFCFYALEIHLEDLVGYGELALLGCRFTILVLVLDSRPLLLTSSRLAVCVAPILIDMLTAGDSGLLNELEDFLEHMQQVLLLLIMEA